MKSCILIPALIAILVGAFVIFFASGYWLWWGEPIISWPHFGLLVFALCGLHFIMRLYDKETSVDPRVLHAFIDANREEWQQFLKEYHDGRLHAGLHRSDAVGGN